MKLNKKTINDVPIEGKKVLVRTGFNVPLKKSTSKKDELVIADDYRIERGLATIKTLLEKGCAIVLVAKLGRPEGRDMNFSLEPVAKRLSELLDYEVKFCPESTGPVAQQAKKQLKTSEILMLENLLFDKRERANDYQFAAEVASGCDYFVQDGFSIIHRSNALVEAVGSVLPSVAGIQLLEEYEMITEGIHGANKPKCAIVGGAKITTKIGLLDVLVDKMDIIVIGGILANTFLVAQGHDVGSSIYDETEVDLAKKVLEDMKKANTNYVLPDIDVAVALSTQAGEPRKEIRLDQITAHDIILDFGEESTKKATEFINQSASVFWNGPVGMAELDAFSYGTKTIALTLRDSAHIKEVVIGGGDTGAMLNKFGVRGSDRIHVSTGGGACLSLIAGVPLPGIEVLLGK